jgi:hypothetical protein
MRVPGTQEASVRAASSPPIFSFLHMVQPLVSREVSSSCRPRLKDRSRNHHSGDSGARSGDGEVHMRVARSSAVWGGDATINCNGPVRSHELRRHLPTGVVYQIA